MILYRVQHSDFRESVYVPATIRDANSETRTREMVSFVLGNDEVTRPQRTRSIKTKTMSTLILVKLPFLTRADYSVQNFHHSRKVLLATYSCQKYSPCPQPSRRFLYSWTLNRQSLFYSFSLLHYSSRWHTAFSFLPLEMFQDRSWPGSRGYGSYGSLIRGRVT